MHLAEDKHADTRARVKGMVIYYTNTVQAEETKADKWSSQTGWRRLNDPKPSSVAKENKKNKSTELA